MTRFLRRLRPIEIALLAGALLALLAIPAVAVPPPKGSPADERLQHYTDAQRAWIAQQHDHRGRFCCSEGDFDFVTLREVGDTLEAKADHPNKAHGIPEGWLTVEPERRVDLKGQKDVPDITAAWYYNGQIQCIIVGGGF